MKFFHNYIFKNSQHLYLTLLNDKKISQILGSDSNRKILDIGTGSGVSVKALLSLNNKLNIEGLDIQNSLWKEYQNIKITLYDGKNFPYVDKAFDLCCIFFVLHHCDNPARLLSEAARVSRQNILVLEELKLNKIQVFFLSLYDIVVNFLIFKHFIQIPKFISDNDLKKTFSKASLEIKSEIEIRKGIIAPRKAYLLTKKSV